MEEELALFQITYLSSLVRDEPEILPAILDAAVRNNKRSGITGMLLYADGNVVQVLEGEKDVVLQTFQSIELDKRHKGIIVLLKQEIASRQFASWSMGFKRLTKADLEKFPDVAHVFEARQDEISVRSRSGAALIILTTFADPLSMGVA